MIFEVQLDVSAIGKDDNRWENWCDLLHRPDIRFYRAIDGWPDCRLYRARLLPKVGVHV